MGAVQARGRCRERGYKQRGGDGEAADVCEFERSSAGEDGTAQIMVEEDAVRLGICVSERSIFLSSTFPSPSSDHDAFSVRFCNVEKGNNLRC